MHHSQFVEKERIHWLKNIPEQDGDYVLYWMQQSQRVLQNPALCFAIGEANWLHKPVLVLFALTPDYPDANLRHYQFMLEGLQQTADDLEALGIQFVLQIKDPPKAVIDLSKHACLTVCDRGYLRHQRLWRKRVSENAEGPVVEIEGDCVVPVETASGKLEFAARTIRSKINSQIPGFLKEIKPLRPENQEKIPGITGENTGNPDQLFQKLKVNADVPAVSHLFPGGTREALSNLEYFLQTKLNHYGNAHNDPLNEAASYLGPYLHFGQISPVTIALAVHNSKPADTDKDSREKFLEELIIRRELAANHAWFNQKYDQYNGLPDWATTTLREHAKDKRDKTYTLQQLENCRTHDIYWNASMMQMRETGYLHNHMRMYWGKQILFWSTTPQKAYENCLYLNNKYFLDGRDINSFTNVAWIFGRHDRPWPEKPVFGKVRSMNASGLRRKFNADAWADSILNPGFAGKLLGK